MLSVLRASAFDAPNGGNGCGVKGVTRGGGGGSGAGTAVIASPSESEVIDEEDADAPPEATSITVTATMTTNDTMVTERQPGARNRGTGRRTDGIPLASKI